MKALLSLSRHSGIRLAFSTNLVVFLVVLSSILRSRSRWESIKMPTETKSVEFVILEIKRMSDVTDRYVERAFVKWTGLTLELRILEGPGPQAGIETIIPMKIFDHTSIHTERHVQYEVPWETQRQRSLDAGSLGPTWDQEDHSVPRYSCLPSSPPWHSNKIRKHKEGLGFRV
jgi:hypothetical protein